MAKDGRRLIISRKFHGENFRNYTHTYRIYNKRGELVQNEVFPIPSGPGRIWQMTTKKIPRDAWKFEYYMDKVLCVEEFLYRQEGRHD